MNKIKIWKVAGAVALAAVAIGSSTALGYFLGRESCKPREVARRTEGEAAGEPREVARRTEGETAGKPREVARRTEEEVIIALGGDGTILRCVHEHPGVPVLGFNLGGLGYLSPVEKKDFDSALALLAAGRYRIAERTMLRISDSGTQSTLSDLARPQATLSDAIRPYPTLIDFRSALNDIVITREMTGHAAMLDVSVDGRRATRYLADGLVIATPTGSTAYSLSAGGPVVMSDSRTFVITPMNPHALGIRPLVVADNVKISVTAVTRDTHCTASDPASTLGVYADGEAVSMLAPGESIEISKSSVTAKFVELEGYDPYAVLAHKLGWTGTSL